MDKIVGITMIAVSCFLLLTLKDVPFEAAAFPAAFFGLLILLSLILVLGPWKGKYKVENARDVIAGIGIMIVYTLLLPFAGFIVSTIGMMWLSVWLAGHRKRWYVPPLIAVGLTMSIYAVFFELLAITPP